MQVLLQLDSEQKRKMVELRQFFLVKLRTILDRRKLIHAEITVRSGIIINAQTIP